MARETLRIFHSTCDQLFDLHAAGLPQQSDQSWYAITALDGHFVIMVFPKGNVAQSPAGLTVDFRFRVVQQFHQDRHAVQLADVLLDAVVLITQVLQISGRVGLDRVHRVAEHGDDLVQVGVPPAGVSAEAVQADHAAAFVGELQGLCSAHGLEKGIQVPLQLGHEGVIVASSEGTEEVMHAFILWSGQTCKITIWMIWDNLRN